LGLRPAAFEAMQSAGSESSPSLSQEDLMPTKKTPEPKTPEHKSAAKPKSVAKPKSGSKPNALQQPLKPSEDLAAIVGAEPLPRGEVVSKVWTYIKANKLQNPDDGREIMADDKLRKIFGKDKVTMFEMNKHLAAHLK
jgi:upstream activation factor subunit UAF30